MSFFRLFFIVLALGGGFSTSVFAQEILFSLDITEEPVGVGDEVLVRIFDSEQMGGFTYLYPDTVADFSSQVLFAQSMIGENIVFSFGIYRPGEGKVYWEESNQRSTVVPDSGMVTTLPGYVLGELDPGHTVSSSAAASRPSAQESKTQTEVNPKGGETSSSSLGGPFATGVYLPMPDLLAPSNPAFEVPIDPVLDWQFAGTTGNYQYDYQIGNDLPGNVAKSAPVVVVTNTEADLKNSPLLEEEKYYWRVRACDVGTQLLCSPWTEMWQFTTDYDLQEDGNIDLLSPQDGEELGTTTPIFTWDLSGNYQNQGDIFFYVCDASTASTACLATEALFTVDPETVGSNDRESMALPVTGLDSLSDHSSYYWRIERNKNGVIDPGSVGYFSIETAGPGIPEVPGLAYPSANEALISLTPILSWGSVENAAYYEYQHGLYTETLTETSPAPINVGSNVNTSDPGNAPTSLDYSTSYRWRVRACNLGVCSAWSTPRVFTTLYPPVSITYPVYGAGVQATTLEVGWTYDSNLGGPYEEFAVEWSSGKLSSPEGRIEYIPGSELQTVLSQLPASSDINWHVQGRGGGVWQAFSNDDSFLTGAGHGPIGLVTPDGSVEIEPSYPAPPTFDWDDGTGGYQQYQVRVGLANGDRNEWQTFSVFNGTTTSFTWTPLANETDYGWQVRGMIGGLWEAWTDPLDFTTVDDPGPPSMITLDHPRDGTTVYTEYPQFSWLLDQDYDEVVLYLCQAGTCSETTADYTSTGLSGTSTQHTLPVQAAPLLDTTSYTWLVRGRLDVTWSNSAVFGFTTDVQGDGGQTNPPPDPTFITQPFEYDSGNPHYVETNVALVWQPAETATTYQVHVDSDPNWTGPILVINQDWIQPDDLLANTDYYARVKACNNGGCSAWSVTRHFKTKTYTDPAPAAPLLIAPQDLLTGTSTHVLLQWTPGVGTVPGSYVYQVVAGSSFQGASSLFVQTTSGASAALLYSQSYAWRVKGCNSNGANCGPWGGPWAFTTDSDPAMAAPTVPEPISPYNGNYATAVNPSLVWQDNGAPEYRYQLADTPFAETSTLNPPAEYTSYSPSASSGVTQQGVTAYWRVKACNASACSDWTEDWVFGTEYALVQPPIVLLNPSNDAGDSGQTVQFDWNYPEEINKGAQLYDVIQFYWSTEGAWMPQGQNRDTWYTNPDTRTSHTLTGLQQNTRYWWKVRARNQYDHTRWDDSFTYTFYTGGSGGSYPSYPWPVSPADEATNVGTTPTLVWVLDDGGTSHTFDQVKIEWTKIPGGFHNDSDETVFYDAPNLATSHVVGSGDDIALDSNTTYYWRVRAHDNWVWSPFSEIYTFHTGAAPSGQTVTISGTVTDGTNALELAEITFEGTGNSADQDAAHTSSSGYYTRDVPLDWEGIVRASYSNKVPNPLQYSGTYSANTTHNFTMEDPPTATHYPWPVTQEVDGTSVTFIWDLGPNPPSPDRFVVEWIYDDNQDTWDGDFTVEIQEVISSYTVHDLDPNTDYLWRIDSIWDSDPPSDGFAFRTGDDDGGGTPTFSFSGIVQDAGNSNAPLGDVWVRFFGDPGFEDYSDDSDTSTGVYEIPAIQLNWEGIRRVEHAGYMLYQADVGPVSQNETNQNIALTPNVGEKPDPPTLHGPANLPTTALPRPETFTWVNNGSDTYRFYLSENASFDPVFVQPGITYNAANTHVEYAPPGIEIGSGTHYFWKVVACDNQAGCSADSDVWEFLTEENVVQRYYYLKDHLGSVRVVVNDNKEVKDYADYYPFGLEMPGRSSMSGSKARENYTGHELDTGTGLHYANARYYDSVTGRWGVRDPLEEFASPYLYVGNNPMGFTDPTGMVADAAPYCGSGVEGTCDSFIAESLQKIGASDGTFLDDITDGQLESLYWGYRKGELNRETVLSLLRNKGDRERFNNVVVDQAYIEFWNTGLAKRIEEAALSGASLATLQQFAEQRSSWRQEELSKFLKSTGGGIAISLELAIPVQSARSAVNYASRWVRGSAGSSGRTAAKTMIERIAMREIQKNPEWGTKILSNLGDPRWKGWNKYEFVLKSKEGHKAVVHFNGRELNGIIVHADDFKFKY